MVDFFVPLPPSMAGPRPVCSVHVLSDAFSDTEALPADSLMPPAPLMASLAQIESLTPPVPLIGDCRATLSQSTMLADASRAFHLERSPNPEQFTTSVSRREMTLTMPCLMPLEQVQKLCLVQMPPLTPNTASPMFTPNVLEGMTQPLVTPSPVDQATLSTFLTIESTLPVRPQRVQQSTVGLGINCVYDGTSLIDSDAQ